MSCYKPLELIEIIRKIWKSNNIDLWVSEGQSYTIVNDAGTREITKGTFRYLEDPSLHELGKYLYRRNELIEILK